MKLWIESRGWGRLLHVSGLGLSEQMGLKMFPKGYL